MAARNARLSWPNTRIHKAPTPLLRIGGRAYGALTALYPAALLQRRHHRRRRRRLSALERREM